MYINQLKSNENDKKMVTNPDQRKHDIASAVINQKKSKKHFSIWMIIKQLPQVNTVFNSICVFSLLLALYGNIRQTNVEEKLKLLIQLQDRVLVLESTLHTTVNSKYFPNDLRPHAIDFNYDTKLSGNRFLTIEKTHRQRRETKSLEQRHTQVTPSPMCLCPSGPPGPPGKRGKRGKKGDSGNLGPMGQPGQKGQKGDLGYPAMDVFQTVKGLKRSITTLRGGSLGYAEIVAVKGEPGEPGPPGPTGPPGITGIPGRDGESGPPGQPGLPGKGLQGISGPIGPQGVVGAPGSKGEKGDKGERGLTTTIKGDEFPTGIIEGPPGPPGPPGLQGPHGEKGDVGPQGPPGPQGEKGPRGKRGKRIFGSGKDEDYEDAAVTVLRGPPGPPGISGRDGKDGKDGSKGERGEPGEPGSLGPRGLDGIPGETGLVGPPGMPGYEGPAGQKGDRGDIGPPGLMGPPGLPGPPGYPGSKGEKGDKGDSKYRKMRRRENDELSNAPQISLVDYVCGPPGPPGPMGSPGRPGLQGEHGSNGPKGDRGEKGDKGEKGPMGLPGQLAIRSDARSVSYNGKTDHSMTYMAKQKGTGRVKWRLGTTSSSIIGGERDRRHTRYKDIQNVYVNQSEYAGKYQRYLKRMRKCGQEGSYKHFDNGTQAHCSDHVRELYTFLHISNRQLTSINRLESRYKRGQENSGLYYVHLCFDVKNLPDNIEEATLRLSVRTHGLEADILPHNNDISNIFTPYQLNVSHQLSSVRTRNEMAEEISKYDSKAVRGLIFNKENKKPNSKGRTLISCFDQKTKDKIISEEKYVLNLKMFHVIEPYGRIWLDSRAIELNISQLCSKSNVWVEFDVMKVLESKPFKSLNRLDFEIQCEHCTNLRVQISGDISSHFGRLQEPALYAIISSGGRRAKRSRKYQHFIENGHRKPRKTDCYEGNKKCCRHGMQVVFKEMKGFEFIIQPKLFDAGYCSGKCPPRYNPAHHHALLQSLIRRYDQKRVPRLCCVPSKLTELEVLHVDERDSTKLKVSTWRDMKLLECACS